MPTDPFLLSGARRRRVLPFGTLRLTPLDYLVLRQVQEGGSPAKIFTLNRLVAKGALLKCYGGPRPTYRCTRAGLGALAAMAFRLRS